MWSSAAFGLGYTARAVLEHAQVRSLLVVDALAEVIEWHRRGLLPLGPELTSDPRCRLILGDFFAGAASAAGFDPIILDAATTPSPVDIDHSPESVLHRSHAAFYTVDGLTRLCSAPLSRRRDCPVVERCRTLSGEWSMSTRMAW